jgi:alpha,alpha-trehalase
MMLPGGPTRPLSTPIGDYGMLADGSSAALVDRRGSIDWLCLPRYDSPALFGRLLDPDAGHWSIAPAGDCRVSRRYLPGTLVIETSFTTATGTARLRDAFAVPAGQRGHDLGIRPPHELLREVEGVTGSVELRVELVPRPEYGLVRPLLRVTGERCRTFGGPNQFAARFPVPIEAGDASATASLRLRAGQRLGFSLVWAPPEETPPEPTAPERVPERIADTVSAWQSWEDEHDIYRGSHRELVLLSSRVLKGLTYRPTGAIVAAPTTSLPETTAGEGTWDYRYAWIRDASQTVAALYLGSCPDEAVDFISFMTSAAGGSAGGDSSLQIMYGIGGEHDLSERELPHLRGWRGARPVRVGNAAWVQTQLDVYGELLSALHQYQGKLGELHPEIQRFAAGLADTAARRWQEPDAGIWEFRDKPRHYVSSKVLCWVALDRAIALAPRLGRYADPEAWAAERDRIRAAVLDQGWSPRRQAYVQAFGAEDLDAAVLLMPRYGFLPAGDERMRSTIEVVARELASDGLVRRYESASEEGAFVLCSFWLVSALAGAGEIDRAEALFDRVVGYANDLGLLAEEVDPRTSEMLGNVPQAYSHVGLIDAAAAIDRARFTVDAVSRGR